MTDWTPEGPEAWGGDDAAETPVALAGTAEPVPVRVEEFEDDRIPEGMVGLATRIGGRLVARCVVSPRVARAFAEHDTFGAPVRLLLAAREAPPGLQCQLFALTPMPAVTDDADDAEPWAGSVPGAGYEAAREEPAAGDDDEAPTVAIPLGQIVRFARDRRHPDQLALETVDILSKIVAGQVVEVIDKALEDLLGP